jgi:hypothetical protein
VNSTGHDSIKLEGFRKDAVRQIPGFRLAAISCFMANNLGGVRLISPLFLLFVLIAPRLWPQSAGEAGPSAVTAWQIVDQMQRHNQSRTEALKHWESTRHYKVEYKGFSTTVAGEMEVEVTFDAASGKSFRIISQSGSSFLCDKVLKRAVDSEKEAATDKRSTALTSANYSFQLLGNETLAGRPAYVLNVEPLTPSKFLYRGKIWVDAADYALVKMDGEPAKSPSMWISRTALRFSNAKTGDFWLPEQTRSETRVRVGGTAVLTINYGAYQVAPRQALGL